MKTRFIIKYLLVSPRSVPLFVMAPTLCTAAVISPAVAVTLAFQSPKSAPPVLTNTPKLAPVHSMNPEDPPREISLLLDVDATGQVQTVHPLRLKDPFYAAATEAALQLRFFPATQNGQPMSSRVPFTFVFHPPGSPAAQNSAAQAPEPDRPAQTPLPPASQPSFSDIIEVQTAIQTTASTQKEQSAQAVQSLSLKNERAQSSDLGRALSKSRGLSLQQSAGLGSNVRVLLAGYAGPQVRYFFDGLPLAWSGYIPRLSAISADLIGRVDLFQGVVPVSLGTDALGGALHLIGRPYKPGFHGLVGYEFGSFGNHRLVARLSHRGSRHRFSVSTQYDHAKNRYPMNIEVPNAKGELQEKTIHRFHDAFSSVGVRATWEHQRANWRVKTITFAHRLQKELQSNVVMSVPFGEAHFQRERIGLVTRWSYHKGSRFRASLDLGGTAGRVQLVDLGTCRYDWFGRCVRDNGIQGEIGDSASDQHLRQVSGLVIPKLLFVFSKSHQLVLRSTLRSLWRKGENRALVAGQLDPLRTPRTLLSSSTGASYNLSLWQKKLRNELFSKLYTQHSFAVDYGVSDTPIEYKTRQHAFGWGNALRLELLPGWQIKASYEWTTRMPGADERFGDGVLILPNLELRPERSHNFNLATSYRFSAQKFGRVKIGARGFLRHGDDLVLLLGSPNDLRYRNMLKSRVFGGEGDAQYASPGQRISLSTHWTFQRPENRSKLGDFSDYLGDRIPNQPYRWGHAQLSLRQPAILMNQDRLAVFFALRWVGQFARTWESLGVKETKQFIPAQTTLSTGLTYRIIQKDRALALAIRIDNLANAQVYDFFGVPRPGRNFSTKVNFEF